ncbi:MULTISPECIES: hypothetical protein [unclassified Pseudomonas]|uniref:hypothetical protein n=1 Tax=unclassified Pseudomonas TaxID=196821 RepID=UPI001B33E4DA|nr:MULTISPECIES: hypothetical protein [unclassified Pseudomonas]MBP5946795.1 hypothetical protein [Pseudomonas sp. P9(2020)]MBZ9564933.1 hypothetical protein [Pseudomonas sp. P116]
MSTPQKPDNSTLVHKELDIPGRTGPVSLRPMVWGINRAAALDNFPRQGLLCRAGPWSLMGVGDKLTIIMGGDQVRQVTIDKDEVDKELQMFVPSARLTEGTHTISYTVTRLNQGAEPSEVMDVLVKLTRPGGHDEFEGPGHSELIMSIPKDIIQGGIDKDNVAAGVPITIGNDDGLPPYPNAATGDQIQVSWGGVFVLSDRLTHEQAEGKDEIIVHIDKDIILKAEDSDQTGLAVAFEVYDLVDNRSTDWSFAQRVVVTTDATRLVAPLHEKAVNNVLDVKDLKGTHSNAQIVAFDLDTFKEGDIIILRLRCTPVEGAPIDIEITGEPLFNLPSVHLMPVPNALLRLMAQSLLAMSYRVKKADGSPDLRSKTRFISVIGELQRLAAPVALDAVSGALDPELATVRIKIPFDDSFAEGQAIQLYWLGTRPDLTPYLPDLLLRSITQGDVTAKQPLFMNIRGSEHLPPITGGQLELYYRVLIDDSVLGTMNRVNQTHAIRESVHAEILQIGEPRLELPEPKVDGVVDGVLPPDTNGTTLTVEYRDTAKGDVVTYKWFGSKTGEASDSVTLSSFTAGRPISFNIDAKWIKGNEGGMVSASYSIIRKAGGTSYSNALEFHVGVALELTAPDIKEAIGDSLNPIAAKDTLTAIIPQYPGMLATDMISVTWTGTPGNGSHTTAAVAVGTVGPKEIVLNNKVLAFNLGLTVTVTYTVTRNGMPKISDSLVLAVQTIKDEDGQLPTPAIDGAAGDELDVNALNEQARTRVPGWPFIAEGQTLWLRYFGTEEDGSTFTHETYVATTIPADGVPEGVLPRAPVAELRKLKDGSSLRIEFKVGFEGNSDESTAVVFPVRTYTVNAVQDIKPQITSVKGSPSGIEIVSGGTTVETAVTLTGSAAKGQKVDVLDGTTSKGQPIADGTTGIWKLTITGLSVAAHSFTAKALYGSGLTSDPRTITVIAEQKPVISKVTGSNGADIPHNGSTVDTRVTLTGSATPNLEVDILDGATSLGKVSVNTSGIWTKAVTGLAAVTHTFTAKATYGSGLVSDPRIITVIAVQRPVITKVAGSNGVNIPNNGSTYDTRLTLTGTATPNQEGKLWNGASNLIGEVSINSSGIWTTTVTGLRFASHAFYVSANNLQSMPARVVTVIDSTPPKIVGIYGSHYGAPGETFIPSGGTWSKLYIRVVMTGAPGRTVSLYNTNQTPSRSITFDAKGSGNYGPFSGGPVNSGPHSWYVIDPITGTRSNNWALTWTLDTLK